MIDEKMYNEVSQSEDVLMLTEFIGKGATRECYLHPINNNKCVKVLINNKSTKILERELHHSFVIQAILGNLVVAYDRQLVQTDKGIGLVCELLKDDNGQFSKPIRAYIKNGKIDSELKEEMDYFVNQLLAHKLYFYDFNLNNFVVQIKKGKKKLKYIDLKSYENNKSWTFLKLEKFISPLAESIMVRRLKRLYKMLGINYYKDSQIFHK